MELDTEEINGRSFSEPQMLLFVKRTTVAT